MIHRLPNQYPPLHRIAWAAYDVTCTRDLQGLTRIDNRRTCTVLSTGNRFVRANFLVCLLCAMRNMQESGARALFPGGAAKLGLKHLTQKAEAHVNAYHVPSHFESE